MKSLFTVFFLIAVVWASGGVVKLNYASAPIDNPLKGLVPYAGDWDGFPHSMEFSYIALSAMVVGEGRYDWRPMEEKLDAISGRGHQAIFRIFLEYPEQASGVPAYLGMDVPDYGSPALADCLKGFIAAFGGKYDGDPRIGFLTAGLLGKWGEWHTYPEEERWAGKELQALVMDAYEKAFKKTPVLLRYPVGESDKDAANGQRPFGYHDDSFAWGTLESDNVDEAWHYMNLKRKAGPGALQKWRMQPIGGEIRPEAWGAVFDPKPANERIQDFAKCVEATHVSWLMDSGMFNEKHRSDERVARAKLDLQKMGYEFYVASAKWEQTDNKLRVSIQIENKGVAPFYAAWPIEWTLIGTGAVTVGEEDLRHILPDEIATRSQVIDLKGIVPGSYHLAVRVPNALSNGRPVRFANETQDKHRDGWLSLAEVQIPMAE
jgi:hypothetical protein